MRSVFLILLWLNTFNHFSAQELRGIVSKVTDGDSFEFVSSGKSTRIRLHGIDCPEINQPYGDSARLFLLTFLHDTVSMIPRDIDKYGRTVADIFYNDTLINFQLISNGLAWHYKKYSADEILAEAENIAKETHTGLWATDQPIAPWDWRAGNYDRTLLQANAEIKYFICVGKENNTFHTIHYCTSLKSCNSSTVLVTQAEAQEVYQKQSCPVCIQSTH